MSTKYLICPAMICLAGVPAECQDSYDLGIGNGTFCQDDAGEYCVSAVQDCLAQAIGEEQRDACVSRLVTCAELVEQVPPCDPHCKDSFQQACIVKSTNCESVSDSEFCYGEFLPCYEYSEMLPSCGDFNYTGDTSLCLADATRACYAAVPTCLDTSNDTECWRASANCVGNIQYTEAKWTLDECPGPDKSEIIPGEYDCAADSDVLPPCGMCDREFKPECLDDKHLCLNVRNESFVSCVERAEICDQKLALLPKCPCREGAQDACDATVKACVSYDDAPDLTLDQYLECRTAYDECLQKAGTFERCPQAPTGDTPPTEDPKEVLIDYACRSDALAMCSTARAECDQSDAVCDATEENCTAQADLTSTCYTTTLPQVVTPLSAAGGEMFFMTYAEIVNFADDGYEKVTAGNRIKNMTVWGQLYRHNGSGVPTEVGQKVKILQREREQRTMCAYDCDYGPVLSLSGEMEPVVHRMIEVKPNVLACLYYDWGELNDVAFKILTVLDDGSISISRLVDEVQVTSHSSDIDARHTNQRWAEWDAAKLSEKDGREGFLVMYYSSDHHMLGKRYRADGTLLDAEPLSTTLPSLSLTAATLTLAAHPEGYLVHFNEGWVSPYQELWLLDQNLELIRKWAPGPQTPTTEYVRFDTDVRLYTGRLKYGNGEIVRVGNNTSHVAITYRLEFRSDRFENRDWESKLSRETYVAIINTDTMTQVGEAIRVIPSEQTDNGYVAKVDAFCATQDVDGKLSRVAVFSRVFGDYWIRSGTEDWIQNIEAFVVNATGGRQEAEPGCAGGIHPSSSRGYVSGCASLANGDMAIVGLDTETVRSGYHPGFVHSGESTVALVGLSDKDLALRAPLRSIQAIAEGAHDINDPMVHGCNGSPTATPAVGSPTNTGSPTDPNTSVPAPSSTTPINDDTSDTSTDGTSPFLLYGLPVILGVSVLGAIAAIIIKKRKAAAAATAPKESPKNRDGDGGNGLEGMVHMDEAEQHQQQYQNGADSGQLQHQQYDGAPFAPTFLSMDGGASLRHGTIEQMQIQPEAPLQMDLETALAAQEDEATVMAVI